MASYPGTIATLTNPLSTDYMDVVGHAGQHSSANDEIEAIETELGTDVAGDYTDLKTRLNADTPVGAVMMWLTGSIPQGWLLIDGTNRSRTTYSRLFSLWGTTFGNGDGSTTFGTPDMRQRVPVGFDSTVTAFNALGKTGGEATHVITALELPSHTHTIDHGHAHNVSVNGTGAINTGNDNTDHAHTVNSHSHGGATGSMNRSNPHGHSALATARSIYAASGSSAGLYAAGYDTAVSSTDINHEHGIGAESPGTGGRSAYHQHDYNHGHGVSGGVTSMTGNSGATGSGTAMNLLQPFLVVNFIVKY